YLWDVVIFVLRMINGVLRQQFSARVLDATIKISNTGLNLDNIDEHGERHADNIALALLVHHTTAPLVLNPC
ncbi:hypothetical protein V5O48_016358, partial [Marasmius crinis-equi]